MIKNIVIIGMPGAGKTSVARAVAEKLNRPMIDIDTEIIKKHGDIPQIFEQQGEKAFRAYEKEAVIEAAAAIAILDLWIERQKEIALHQIIGESQ